MGIWIKKNVHVYGQCRLQTLTWPREWLPPLLLMVTLYTSVTEVLDSMPTMVCPASWMAVHQFTRSSGVRVFFSDPVKWNDKLYMTYRYWHITIYCTRRNIRPYFIFIPFTLCVNGQIQMSQIISLKTCQLLLCEFKTGQTFANEKGENNRGWKQVCVL